MNLATMQFFSPSLHRHVTYSAILPEKGSGPAPVLIQLHGYTDNHSAWLSFSNLVRHARPYRMIIILPDGGISFYLNNSPTEQYEDFIMKDLTEHVTASFQVRPGPWAIGGLSMGGYGAMRLGCKYPSRFASIWAHSGVYPSKKELTGFPVDNKADADVYAITRQLAGSGNQPEITFDCGTEDSLLEHNRRLHKHMQRIKLSHQYFEHPGAHTWDYWDEHVQEALKQHARVLDVTEP